MQSEGDGVCLAPLSFRSSRLPPIHDSILPSPSKCPVQAVGGEGEPRTAQGFTCDIYNACPHFFQEKWSPAPPTRVSTRRYRPVLWPGKRNRTRIMVRLAVSPISGLFLRMKWRVSSLALAVTYALLTWRHCPHPCKTVSSQRGGLLFSTKALKMLTVDWYMPWSQIHLVSNFTFTN